MGFAVSGYAPEVSLDELLDEEEDHFICGCRPQITLCGRYEPSTDPILYIDEGPNDCEDCVKVWQSRGCGACGCNSDWGCPPCLQSYQRYLASTD